VASRGKDLVEWLREKEVLFAPRGKGGASPRKSRRRLCGREELGVALGTGGVCRLLLCGGTGHACRRQRKRRRPYHRGVPLFIIFLCCRVKGVPFSIAKEKGGRQAEFSSRWGARKKKSRLGPLRMGCGKKRERGGVQPLPITGKSFHDIEHEMERERAGATLRLRDRTWKEKGVNFFPKGGPRAMGRLFHLLEEEKEILLSHGT